VDREWQALDLVATAVRAGAVTVVVPYVPGLLHAQTEAFANARDDAHLHDVSGSDDAYFRLLAEEWHMDGDLLIVEQDMVPAPGVVEEMLACRWPWCASPFEVANRQEITDGLGCTKFSAMLKALRPQLMRTVGEICDDGLPAKNWRRLDTRISRTLRAAGHRPHLHAVSTHLHDYRTRP
jgi:hypothetical protein